MHIAVIPGGRWVTAQGLPRSDAQRAGLETLRRVVRAAPGLGIGVLTIHALSSDLRRPAPELPSILATIGSFLELETPACVRAGVRVTVLGCRHRLPGDVGRAIEDTERATAAGTRLDLRIALDYSARGAILAALLAGIVGPARLACEPEALLGPDVDLLIRTGGERRLGDFLLWECAYADLVFVDTPWPDFGERELAAAVLELRRRRCRSGGPPEARAGPAAADPRAQASPAPGVAT